MGAVPHQPLTDVLLPATPGLASLVVGDRHPLMIGCSATLKQGARRGRGWHVDLGVFPREACAALATVSAHISVRGNEDEATHA